MEIRKGAVSAGVETVSAEDLALINRLSRGKLTAEQVYTFALRLCDNEVDRDFERFEEETLAKLGEMFVGKTGIFDHQWQAQGQTARIYRTELCCEGGITTKAGGGYCYIKAYAYMLRNEKNQPLIDEIEAGIKKEVSVGCSVRHAICSICGEDMHEGHCQHEKGRSYNGKLCFARLKEPTDAYEWSFVAVPAQPAAGVVKAFGQGEKTYAPQQLKKLEAEAEMGRRYLALLRQEVVKAAMLAEEKLDGGVFAGIAEKLSETELLELKKVYQARAESKYRPVTQLKQEKQESVSAGAFLV